MGLLDAPRGLISRLPVIGGAFESKPEAEKPTASEPAAETEPVDEPDSQEPEPEPEERDEPDTHEDEPDSEEDEPDSEEAQPDSDPDGPGGEAEEPSGSGSEEPSGSDSEDISDTTAPSIGPNTVIEKDTPEERLARHEQSDKDAMGLDKRREVIGGSYSASFGKQLSRWLIVVGIVVAAAFGAKLLIDDLDKPPAQAAEKAPWAGNHTPPKDLE